MKNNELDLEIEKLEKELQKTLLEERTQYENIEIPQELKNVVNSQIQKGENIMKESQRKIRKTGKFLWTMIPAAAVIVFIIGLNTSYSFASAMEEIPVIGAIAKVFTIRSYHEKDADKEVEVKVPQVETEEEKKENTEPVKEEVQEMVVDVNAEIEKATAEYVKGAEERIAEYKKAFLETGGTEEEFSQKDIKVNVDYEIKNQDENYLSFVVVGEENWSGAYAVYYYYNLDMKNGKRLTLKDLLGENYIEMANTQILAEMKKRTAENENFTYFDKEMGGFTTISDETNFYINENGNPVIVFDKYEVAPGFMGRQEFEIVK